MRSENLLEGEYYALELSNGNECVRVKLKSLEARYGSKVIVLPAHGADDEHGVEISIGSIRSTWDDYLAENLELENTAAFWAVLWIPSPGDVVELNGTDALPWTVRSVSFADGEGWAVLRGEIFGRPQERTVAITELRRRRDDVPGRQAEAIEDGSESSPWSVGGDAPAEPIAEMPRMEPVHNLQPETIAERLVFSDAARETFRGICPCGPTRDEQKMRTEVERWGHIGEFPGRSPDFVEYVVPGRFRFVLDEDPRTVEGDIWVETIVDIRSEKTKEKHRKRHQAAKSRRKTGPKLKRQPKRSKANRPRRSRGRRPGRGS